MKKASLLVGIVLGIIGTYIWQWCSSPSTAITYQIEQLYFLQSQETLYLKRANWGVNGNGQVVAISQNDSAGIDKFSKKDYILEGPHEIFYRQHQDTLLVYSFGKFKKPVSFQTKVIIKTIEIDNRKQHLLYQAEREAIKKL